MLEWKYPARFSVWSLCSSSSSFYVRNWGGFRPASEWNLYPNPNGLTCRQLGNAEINQNKDSALPAMKEWNERTFSLQHSRTWNENTVVHEFCCWRWRQATFENYWLWPNKKAQEKQVKTIHDCSRHISHQNDLKICLFGQSKSATMTNQRWYKLVFKVMLKQLSTSPCVNTCIFWLHMNRDVVSLVQPL